MIDDLIKLSRNPTPAGRRDLLRSLSDMFLDDAEPYSDRLLFLFTDVLGALLKQVDTGTRSEFAERVAVAPHTGQAMHCRLAEGEIDVAGPVLRKSRLLDDDTLIDIAGQKGQSHLKAIAGRDRLSEAVTDILVDKGDATVLQVVTENLGARFSEQGFCALADAAPEDARLMNALSYRADMPRAAADRILAMLPDDARARLSALISLDRDAVSAIFSKAATLANKKKLGRAIQRLEAKGLIQQVRFKEATLDQVVMSLAENDRVLDLAMVLAEFANVEESLVAGAILRVNVAPVVVLLRTLDMGEEAVGSLANLRCRRLNLPNSMREHMLKSWRELDTSTAKRAMTFTMACHAVHQSAA